MHYHFFCAPTLARKYEIKHWLRSSKTINWSADSFQINHVTSMSLHTWAHNMVMWYWSVATLFRQLSTILWMSNIKDTCQDTPETPLPFDSLPYPTRTICRRLHIRMLSQSRDNQTKRGWPYSMGMGLCPKCASRLWEPRYNSKWWRKLMRRSQRYKKMLRQQKQR